MAGGFGEINAFTKNLPKAMLKVGSHTLMEILFIIQKIIYLMITIYQFFI